MDKLQEKWMEEQNKGLRNRQMDEKNGSMDKQMRRKTF